MAKQTNLDVAVSIVRAAGTIANKEQKQAVIQQIMDKLSVSRNNAGVYLFKAQKIVGSDSKLAKAA